MPPANSDVEMALIGSILLDPSIWGDVRELVNPGDFFGADCQVLFRTIRALVDQGKPIDPLLLEDALKQGGDLERAGGEGALPKILRETPNAANWRSYAQVVQELALARELITASEATIRAVYDRAMPIDGLLESARAGLAHLERRWSKGAAPAGGHATLADAAHEIGETRWFWEGWIPRSAMTLLAAKAGEGKTRTAMDLVRRLWLGQPFPDGSHNPYPAETPSLWLLVDRNWGETAAVAENFGVPLEAIHLHSPKAAPLTTPELDDPATIAALEAQIRELGPGLVVIDTITYATNRNTARAEEAKAAFDALLNLAASTGAPILALTHLNKEGEALNRRITERARSVIALSHPDPEGQPDRRKLWVSKTAAKKPDGLGTTLRDDCNEYDDAPPTEPGKRTSGPAPKRKSRNAAWLWDQLQAGPASLGDLVNRARVEGILSRPTDETPKPSISPLYDAKGYVPDLHPGFEIEEFEVGDPERGNRQYKHWRIAESLPNEDPPAF